MAVNRKDLVFWPDGRIVSVVLVFGPKYDPEPRIGICRSLCRVYGTYLIVYVRAGLVQQGNLPVVVQLVRETFGTIRADGGGLLSKTPGGIQCLEVVLKEKLATATGICAGGC